MAGVPSLPPLLRVVDVEVAEDAHELFKMRLDIIVEARKIGEGSVRRRGHVVVPQPVGFGREVVGLDAGDLEEDDFGVGWTEPVSAILKPKKR